MNIKEEFNRNAKNVIRKETSNPDLFVLKYHRNVFFSGKWNDFFPIIKKVQADQDAFAAMPEAERRAWIEQQFDWSKQ